MAVSGPIDVAVVGGGLAGLAAATCLARGGRKVTLLERASALGGRARTHEAKGFRFNLGPHALYLGGPATEVLAELGVRYPGGKPPPAGLLVREGRLHYMPGGPFSLLATGALGLRGKAAIGGLMGSLPKLDHRPLATVTIGDWLDREVKDPRARDVMSALVRVGTYGDDARQSAGAALEQVRRAITTGVLYVDGGWQTLVDGLRAAAEAAGVAIETGAAVARVDCEGGAVRAVELEGGATRPAAAAVIAATPAVARALAGDGKDGALARAAEAAIPVRAACLDVGLRRLPAPRATFALGVDRPTYLSVHSALAKGLAPADGGAAATVSAMIYLGPEPRKDPAEDERELEGLLDLVQPGWRAEVVERRFLPRIVVASALVTAAAGGLAGRPGPELAGIAGLALCGDWIGPDPLLADASLGSARRAARQLLGAAAPAGSRAPA